MLARKLQNSSRRGIWFIVRLFIPSHGFIKILGQARCQVKHAYRWRP